MPQVTIRLIHVFQAETVLRLDHQARRWEGGRKYTYSRSRWISREK